jgi:nitrite reductase/ring-hydroxylating ferredoxin subunit
MHLPESTPAIPKESARARVAVTAGRVEELPPGHMAIVALPGGDELALYNLGGEFFATDNFCPHKGAPLTDGRLYGDTIECGWHGWRFCVRTGECEENGSAVETYPVVIEEGFLKILT